MERDEIYLIDMWRIVAREWRWFVAVLAIIVIATFVFMRTTKPQWQATAWIQIGQVDTAPPGQDPKVEPLQRVLERLQLAPFQNDVLQSIHVAPATPEGGLFRASLKVEPLPYAGPLIKLTIRAHSPQQARELAEATVARLQAVHGGLEGAQLRLARARLDEVQTALHNAIAERDRLQQAAAQSRDGVAGLLLASKDEGIHTLQETRGDLLARLSAAYTYSTSLMWPVYVPEGAVFPNPALTWGMGILLGLFLGLVAAVARNAVRRRGASRAKVRIAQSVGA
ncbi:lipopolysaccharide biosynthesis protein [Dyella monticola]|uniref:Lipopolysaccharide biosynthesis protein n=1 Tax=Dyella monticola TaxID=1927958 RepID=A0A370X5P8_9GAMM|nr:lipopolysaccharide biosynthesis protein [Dyella monticola]